MSFNRTEMVLKAWGTNEGYRGSGMVVYRQGSIYTAGVDKDSPILCTSLHNIDDETLANIAEACVRFMRLRMENRTKAKELADE